MFFCIKCWKEWNHKNCVVESSRDCIIHNNTFNMNLLNKIFLFCIKTPQKTKLLMATNQKTCFHCQPEY